MTERSSDRSQFERFALIHGTLVLVTACALMLPGGPPWPLTAPANLLHVLALPSLLLAPFFLAKRRFLALGFQLASLAAGLFFFAVPLGEQLSDEFDSRRPPAELHQLRARETAVDLRVVSINLGVGLAPARVVADFLRELAPDLVVLVEITKRFEEQLEPLVAEQFGHRCYYSSGIDGKALLSLYPIRAQELFRLEDGRPYLRAELEVDGRRVDLLGVHFAPSIGLLDRGAAAGRDLDSLAATLEPSGLSLMAGDFNTTERSPSHARLEAAGFRGSFRETGRGLGHTFPMFGRYFGLPIGRFIRIDYIWHGNGLKAERSFVGPDVGSDHLPLVADFSWRGENDER